MEQGCQGAEVRDRQAVRQQGSLGRAHLRYFLTEHHKRDIVCEPSIDGSHTGHRDEWSIDLAPELAFPPTPPKHTCSEAQVEKRSEHQAGARAARQQLVEDWRCCYSAKFEFQNKMGINVCSAETLRFRRKEKGPFYSHNVRVQWSGEQGGCVPQPLPFSLFIIFVLKTTPGSVQGSFALDRSEAVQ